MTNQNLTLEELREIDYLVDRFEDAWIDGSPSGIAVLLEALPAEKTYVRQALLIELITIDLQRRRQAASSNSDQVVDREIVNDGNHAEDDLPARPLLEDYLEAFPELANGDLLPPRLVIDEFRTRLAAGESPTPEEYQLRFAAQWESLEPLIAQAGRESADNIAKLAMSKVDAFTEGQLHDTQAHETPGKAGNTVSLGDFGQYTIESRIASGGMGVVYKARHKQLNRSVALKMIKRAKFASDEEVQRFRAEAEAAAKLDHPNIVPIYEIGEKQGQNYFSMAFVDGLNLSDVIKKGPLPPKEVARLTKKITEAVAFAHDRGVIHRDLKPANVLIDANGQPKITDFGLAKQLNRDSDLTDTGQVLGTPSYMAPEQAQGESSTVDQRADIWALGATAYCLLTGRPPFQAATALDTLLDVVSRDPVPPRQLATNTPKDLDTIILKCLRKEPGQRYQSAQELAQDVDNFLNGLPIFARPVGQLERAAKWVRRHPARAAAFVLGPFSILAMVILFIGLQVNQQLQSSLYRTEKAEAAEKLANQKLEQSLYFRNITSAQAEYERKNVGNTKRYLSDCPEHLRKIEWHYLSRICDRSLRTFAPDDDKMALTTIALSPDGRIAATSGNGDTIRVWDLSKNKLVHSFTAKGWWRCAFLNGGKELIGVSDRNTIVWNVATGNKLREFELPIPGRSVRVAKNGMLAIQMGFYQVHLYDSTTFDLVRTHKMEKSNEKILGITFSPDGKLLAMACNDWSVRIWDVKTGEQTAELRAHLRPVNHVAFSPDGKWIASTDTQLELILWNLKNSKPDRRIPLNPTNTGSLEFSPDSNRIYRGTGVGNIQIVNLANSRLEDVAKGQTVNTLVGHDSLVTDLGVIAEGRLLTSVSMDGTLKLWDTSSPLDTIGERVHANLVFDVDIDRHSRLVAVAMQQGEALVYDLFTRKIIHRLRHGNGQEASVVGVSFSPIKDWLATSCRDGVIRIYDLKLGREINRFQGAFDHVINVKFSHNGQWLAGLVQRDEYMFICLWDLKTNRLIRQFDTEKNHKKMRDLHFSPNDEEILTSCAGKGVNPKILVYNCQSGKISTYHFDQASDSFGNDSDILDQVSDSWFLPLTVHPDKRLVVANHMTSSTTTFWRIGNPTYDRRFKLTGIYPREGDFSPNGDRLAIAFHYDHTLRVYDTESLDELMFWKHHVAQVSSVRFSNDGNFLISGSFDGTVKILDARPLTDELQIEREALALLRNLTSGDLSDSEIRQKIMDDPIITPKIRAFSLKRLHEFID